MGDLVRKDLGLKSLAKQKVQMLMPELTDKRLMMGCHIWNFLKGGAAGMCACVQ